MKKIMVLNDGTTWTNLDGCSIRVAQDGADWPEHDSDVAAWRTQITFRENLAEVVTFTPEAIVAIGEMETVVAQIGAQYGENSKEYVEACRSGFHALAQVCRLAGAISRDGDAALFGNSFIQYGVIPHRKRNDGDGVSPVEWGVHS